MIEITYAEPTLIDKIRLISEKYSKKHQREKTLEEIDEYREELKEAIKNLNKLEKSIESASNPFDDEQLVYMPDNTWSEAMDVMIMIIQQIMQHNKGNKARAEAERKVNRQIERMREEGLLSVEEYARYSGGTGWQDAVLHTFVGGSYV